MLLLGSGCNLFVAASPGSADQDVNLSGALSNGLHATIARFWVDLIANFKSKKHT